MEGSNSVYKLITKIHFIEYLKHKLPLSPIKAFPAWSSWATISSLVQSAKSMFLISTKTLEVKWWFLIKWVWSASKEVAEVYRKKHSCLLLENACEPCKVPVSKRTLGLPKDWPRYPERRVHPFTLHSNPPPVLYCWKFIYLSSFHWIIIKPCGFARDQSMIAPVVSLSKSMASLDAVLHIQRKWPYAERKVHSSCWLEAGQYLGSDVCSAASPCLSGCLLSCIRERGCMPKSTAQTQMSTTATCC